MVRTLMDLQVEKIADALRRAGLEVVLRAGDDGSFTVGATGRGEGAVQASVLLPHSLLDEYVTEVSGDYRGSSDPESRAMGMVHVLLVEILTKDHGDGRNEVRAVRLGRGRDGHVTFTVDRDNLLPPGQRDLVDEHMWTAERPTGSSSSER